MEETHHEVHEISNAPNLGSLASLNSDRSYLTIKVPREVVGEKITVLIHAEASHNFVHESMVSRKKLKIDLFSGFNVAIRNGNIVHCNQYVLKLKLDFKNYSMVDDFFVFPLEIHAPQLVLGVQWLYSLGDYTTNHQKLEMRFKIHVREVILRGIKENMVQNATAKRTEKILRKEEIVWAASIFTFECMLISSSEPISCHPDIQIVLDRHSKGFGDMPKGLPPQREFQHAIEFEPRTKPIMITTYENPKLYKDEIEKTIKELLLMDHVHPSTSPFSSSVVLAKQKDGTLCMCIDYRVLNKKNYSKQVSHP